MIKKTALCLLSLVSCSALADCCADKKESDERTVATSECNKQACPCENTCPCDAAVDKCCKKETCEVNENCCPTECCQPEATKEQTAAQEEVQLIATTKLTIVLTNGDQQYQGQVPLADGQPAYIDCGSLYFFAEIIPAENDAITIRVTEYAKNEKNELTQGPTSTLTTSWNQPASLTSESGQLSLLFTAERI